MSIVIATLENDCVNIFADRRLVFENVEGTLIETAQIQKIYELSDEMLCGMTGDASWGVALATKLFDYRDKSATELIQIIETFGGSFKEHSTFILGGTYDDGELFFYGFTTENKKGIINFNTDALIATSPIEYLNNCKKYFLDLMDNGFTYKQSAIQTIKFASQQKPKYISEEFDNFRIKL